jgi:hypothetical protein
MLKEVGQIAVKLSRSPLGIIALAFVLVYGIAALLAGTGGFDPNERQVLIWFLVIFPVFIFAVFCWLVTRHHQKLYAPSDFSDEAHFLQLIDGKIETLPEKLSSDSTLKRYRGKMEYQILKTLWTKQVNKFPDYSGLWTFRINANTLVYLKYREAASKLIGEGLISETEQGQLYLTKDGFEYCKSHHKEFPPEQWWPEETIDHEKLRIALGEG